MSDFSKKSTFYRHVDRFERYEGRQATREELKTIAYQIYDGPYGDQVAKAFFNARARQLSKVKS
ncbi:MAG TPA: hypothetical protein VEG44_00220 [Candidatus Acidoferrales bacterium]|nr:hypothetical protein [Candidatus Acidoferrales bacterium]